MYIIAKRSLIFVAQATDGIERMCQVSHSPHPQLVPDWVRGSQTFIYNEKDGNVEEVSPAAETPITQPTSVSNPGREGAEAEWSPYAELPQSSRDFVVAAELDAQSILEGTQKDVRSLVSQAHELGISPSEIDFAPGNSVLQLATATAVQGRQAAADHLFRATTDRYWKFLSPDVEAFMARLDDIWRWAYRRFQIYTEIPGDLKRGLRFEGTSIARCHCRKI